MKQIEDKIKQIEKYLDELASMLPNSLEEYKSSLEKKAICERYVEKIAESSTDLAFMMIKTKKWRTPEDDADTFVVLEENGLIPEKLRKRLQEIKGMRNIIAHQYGNIDDEIVFNAVTQELERDVRKFVDSFRCR